MNATTLRVCAAMGATAALFWLSALAFDRFLPGALINWAGVGFACIVAVVAGGHTLLNRWPRFLAVSPTARRLRVVLAAVLIAFAGSWLVLIGGLAALGWRFSDPASWGFAGVLAASVGPLPFAGLVWALSRGRNV